MKLNEARTYVQEHAQYMPDAPKKPYFVRWPNPYSTRVFFSDDTHDLAMQIFRFANTKEGRKLWLNRG